MNIIVSGVSRGIGFEVVKSLCHEGQHEIICISRNADKLLELKEVCYELNSESKIIPLVHDLSKDDFEKSLIPQILEHFTIVDILINNAGSISFGPIECLSVNDFRNVMKVNLEAPFMLCKLLSPYFAKGSHIVNVSSMGGYQDSVKFGGLTAYSTSKGALCCFTQVLSEEWKDRQIAVNALAIGAVNTEMLEEVFPGYQAPVEANEMGAYIANFALTGNRFYNGKILPVALSTP